MNIELVIAKRVINRFNQEKTKGPVSTERKNQILQEEIEAEGYTVYDDVALIKGRVIEEMMHLHNSTRRAS